MTVIDDLGEIDLSLTLWSIKRFSQISFPNLFINDFASFWAILDHHCHLNVTYVYPEEVVYTFLAFALLGDKQ